MEDVRIEQRRSRIAALIRARRLRVGFSQGELARAMTNVGERTGRHEVVRWESGERMPRADRLLALLEVTEAPEATPREAELEGTIARLMVQMADLRRQLADGEG